MSHVCVRVYSHRGSPDHIPSGFIATEAAQTPRVYSYRSSPVSYSNNSYHNSATQTTITFTFNHKFHSSQSIQLKWPWPSAIKYTLAQASIYTFSTVQHITNNPRLLTQNIGTVFTAATCRRRPRILPRLVYPLLSKCTEVRVKTQKIMKIDKTAKRLKRLMQRRETAQNGPRSVERTTETETKRKHLATVFQV